MKWSKLLGKRKNDGTVANWVIYLDWFLKLAILISAVYQMFAADGEFGIGFMTFVAWLVIVLPQIVTRRKVTQFPIALEIVFFLMVFFQMVVGEARDWYSTVPYYDKFVHLLLPMLVGLIGFSIIYTMVFFGKLQAPIWAIAVITILVSIGIGAIWEIFEYSSDEFLYPRFPNWHHFQGSLTEDALHDTMNDLIADSIGGTIGALIAVIYFTSKTQAAQNRTQALLTQFGSVVGYKK